MYYVTVRQSPMYKQMSLEDFLFNTTASTATINANTANTRTYAVQSISGKFLKTVDVDVLVTKLAWFNSITKELHSKDRQDLYHSFCIPKKSGGLRQIDEPNEELMSALRMLKDIFENDFGALYHTSAFAYVRDRCTIDAVKKHQDNESKWFGKYDLSNFFGSTTKEFVMHQLEMIFPFCEVLKREDGRRELETAIDLAFLNGGLPQGTPLSPTLTNIIMIPVDYKLYNTLRNYNNQTFVYTRYADDFIISSRYSFSFKEIENLIKSTLEEFGAGFSINSKKTRYGSSAGSNWNLGVMLNKDNEITIGHKKKKQFQAMVASYIMDSKNGKSWDINDVQRLEGLRNYYHSVEPERIDEIIEHANEKFGVNFRKLIADNLKVA
ncbi:MAG: RNA-directed DNA polymerase [Oscillospiraceae bacterium]|nr:RNA-directed DNA polymerase [Candidatus Limimonas egerieequi]